MRNQRLWIFTALALATAALGITPSAYCDNPSSTVSDPSAPVPMIEVGAGAESPLSKAGGVNILLRVGFGFYQLADPNAPPGILGQEQLVWAHIDGDIAISPLADGTRVPYIDIKFIPVENSTEFLSQTRTQTIMGNLELFPMKFERNIHLNQQFGYQVSAIGLDFDLLSMQTKQVGFFAQLAVDALGYKMASYVSDLGTFKGFHLGGIALEAGEALITKAGFIIRVALGGSADINFGGDAGVGFAVQSDMQAYVAIKAQVSKMITAFLRAGLLGSYNSGEGTFQAGPEILLGATFIF